MEAAHILENKVMEKLLRHLECFVDVAAGSRFNQQYFMQV